MDLTNAQIDFAYRLLTRLGSTADNPRYWPSICASLNRVGTVSETDEEFVCKRLIDKGYIDRAANNHVQISSLGRQYAERMRKAVGAMLDFDWAERLPRCECGEVHKPTLNKP